MAELSPIWKKLRLARAFLRGHPVWCSWQVTYACNYRCTGCACWTDEVNFSREARAREASADDIRAAARKLRGFGSLLVNLAGGEPLLRRDLGDIVSGVAEHHIPLLTTNGSLVNEQRARKLWQAGLWGASVSLDFADDDKHNGQRGRRGAAERAREALRVLSRTRTRRHQRVNLMCVLNDRNLGEIEELIRFAGENGCTFMVQPYTTAKNGNRGLLPVGEVAGHLLALRRKYRNFISNPAFLAGFGSFYRERGIPGCRAGRSFFNVDNFLNVQKCVEFRAEPVGNLRDLDAPELLRRLRRESERNACRACWYNCRGEIEVLYSARGLAYALWLVARN